MLRSTVIGFAAVLFLAFAAPASASTTAASSSSAASTNQCKVLAADLTREAPGTTSFSGTATAALDEGCAAYVATSSTPSVLDIEFLRGVPGTAVTVGTVKTTSGVGGDLTDLAMTSTGVLYGIDYTSDLWTINTGTGTASNEHPLGAVVNGLVVGAYGQLFASGNGILLIINPANGQLDSSFSTSYTSSGDLAINSKGTLYMTATGAGSDQLVTFNLKKETEEAAKYGIGWPEVYGLVSSYGTLYGATVAGNVLTIKPKTGKGLAVHVGGNVSPVAMGPSVNGMTTPPNHP
jgi:hypothetical protein